MCGVFQNFCSLGKKPWGNPKTKTFPLTHVHGSSPHWLVVVTDVPMCPASTGCQHPGSVTKDQHPVFRDVGQIPRFYERFSSRHGVHLGYMWSLTESLTHELLLYSNLPKWNMVLLRSHCCQIHKGCSKQRWNSQSRKHCFAILFVGDNLIPDLTTCLILEDRNLLGEQRSDPPSQKRLICTRWGVWLVPVIITWLKRLETHFSPAPVVNAFFLPAFLICRLFGLLGVCCDRKMLAVPRFMHRSPQMFFYVWMWVIFCFFPGRICN